MGLFLIGESILFFGGMGYANEIIGQYGKIIKKAENEGSSSQLNPKAIDDGKAND